MKLFAQLIINLSHCRDSEKKASIISTYFQSNETVGDKNNVLRILLGQSPKRIVTTVKLGEWIGEITNHPQWLIDRCEKEVGNHIQTLSLLLPSKNNGETKPGISVWLAEIEQFRGATDEKIKDFIKEKLCEANELERAIILKLMAGVFKSPVVKMDVISGFSIASKLRHEIVSLRLLENSKKHQISIRNLELEIEDENMKIPCIFPENKALDHLTEINWNQGEWMVFGKKEGIEVQLVKHGKAVHLWTRKGNLLTAKFPEIAETVSLNFGNYKCFGQIIPKEEANQVDLLHARLSKKNISVKDLSNCEAAFELWEVLEGDATALQNQNVDQPNFGALKSIKSSSKKELINQHKICRNQGFAGFILRPEHESIYYSWKAPSFSIKAILMYVEFGGMENNGIRSITFGVYSGNQLLPIAKIMEFDSFFDAEAVISFVKENTIERFGPVRTVKPQFIYEIEFDGISRSSRRKSGMVLSNPKIIRKTGNDQHLANNLQYLTDLV